MTEASFSPSTRFAIAQSWWIASELCRRHPQLYVRTFHENNDQYDMLRVFDLTESRDGTNVENVVDMNRLGSIHLQNVPEYEQISWAEVAAQDDPHEIIKRLERYRGWPAPRKAPVTTARILLYRLIAQILSSKINERLMWDARSGFAVSSYSAEARQLYIDQFPGLEEALRQLTPIGLFGDPHSQLWFIVENNDELSSLQHPIVALLDDGRAFTKSGTVLELLPIYQKSKDVLSLAAQVLGEK